MFIEMFAQVKAYFQNADVSFIKEHLAYQFHIVGENDGYFYLEVKDQKLYVEPYNFYDSDATITTSEESVLRIARGTLEPIFAHRVGLVNIVGDMDKAARLREIMEQVEMDRASKFFHWIPGDAYLTVSAREDGIDDEGNYKMVFRLEHKGHQSYGQLFHVEFADDFSIVELPGDVYAQKVDNTLTIVRGNQLNDNGLTELWIKLGAKSQPKITVLMDGKADMVC